MATEYQSLINILRAGRKPQLPVDSRSIEYARQLDASDQLGPLRDNFNIPNRASLKKKALDGSFPGLVGKAANGDDSQTNGATSASGNDSPSIYFVGNSLGAQPKCVRMYLDAQLEIWASIGVNGHFSSLDNSPLTNWQDLAADCAQKSLHIVGAASPSEVIYMNTLTVNLHLMMASFYRPTEKRHKIIAEWKPFPSDLYAIVSQIQWHGLDPSTSFIQVHPDPGTSYIPTSKILSLIDEHASSTALLLLPGIQYYSGQLFDIPLITRHAHKHGITVGWDLAHAAGNVELALHEWDVDFAVWCTYKYLNAGPGATGGAFVHERHHHGPDPDPSRKGAMEYRHRLAGWYGADKAVRFEMAPVFRPAHGAHGFQLSNPSAVDLASLSAALGVFGKTTMHELRSKGLVLTGYLEWLLEGLLWEGVGMGEAQEPPFKIITPQSPLERGSQLSLLLRPGLLDKVSEALREGGVVCDARKPDVIRVAPVPMYCRFEDVWSFIEVFRKALQDA
ncbi:Kynureninase 1 [Madurella mycetomatis]|uniref:Kynureninase n=1 Tax=Madurella mycetomatis TaxID=100816 RepID=A0A175WH10_9PEZI|nr:Kynureninase 1 [Madurella mycetomatis]